ncbi:MAG: hypothetical protein QG597_4501 [Actinomycetota bacterium]|nr:hypothetical protein [Actinomycetota bacterium]
MKREVQGILLILVGGAIARIVLSGSYINYVKAGMKPYLLASAVVLVGLGVMALIDALRGHGDDGPDDGFHAAAEHEAVLTHEHGTMRTAWLLLLPVAAIFLIAPGPLGAYTAAREAASVQAPREGELMPPLPPGDPVPLDLDSYAIRAVWDDGRTLVDRRVELIGFVTPTADGWQLTRLSLACCAADTVPTKVQPVGEVPPYPANTWVAVTGTYAPGGGTDSPAAVPWVTVDTVIPIPAPADPYL